MPYNYKTELARYRRYYQSIEPLLAKPKAQNYTTVVFSFLAVSLFGWYAIRPTIQTILTLRREIQDKTEISQKMEDKINALIQAQATYSEVEAAIPTLNEALPANPDAIPLVVQLRNLARLANVNLSSVQLPAVPLVAKEATPSGTKSKTPAKSDKQQPFEVTAAVTGDYEGILKFLVGLRQMRRIVSIGSIYVVPHTRFDVSASDSATITAQELQLTIQMTSYYLME